MKRILPFLLTLITTILFISCEEKSDPSSDTQSFTRIYSNSEFNTSYYPIDIKQTADGGYLMLCEKKLYDTTARHIYLLKADKFGNAVKDFELEDIYGNPVADLMEVSGSYYFFNMLGTTAYMAKTDAELMAVDTFPLSTTLHYPAAASYDGASFNLLNYDYQKRLFTVSLVDINGGVTNETNFDIEAADEIEGPIIDHFNHTGKQYPFLIGKLANNLYYFNGFTQYSFSLIFTDLTGDNSRIGGIIGQRNHGGVSSIVELPGNYFALSTFNFGSNYFLPKQNVVASDSQTVADLKGNPMPELSPDAKVKTIPVTINSKNYIVYASNTHTNQIGLYVYDQTTGQFISSKYLGFSDPFEVADIIQTADDGLAVCGTTFSAGRFARICLFKLSKAELEGIVD